MFLTEISALHTGCFLTFKRRLRKPGTEILVIKKKIFANAILQAKNAELILKV